MRKGFLSIIVAVMVVALAATLALTAQSNQDFVRQKDNALSGNELKFSWTMGRQMLDKAAAQALYQNAAVTAYNKDLLDACNGLVCGADIPDPDNPANANDPGVIQYHACKAALSQVQNNCNASNVSANGVESRFNPLVPPILDALGANNALCTASATGFAAKGDAGSPAHGFSATVTLACQNPQVDRIEKDFEVRKQIQIAYYKNCPVTIVLNENANPPVTLQEDIALEYCTVYDVTGDTEYSDIKSFP